MMRLLVRLALLLPLAGCVLVNPIQSQLEQSVLAPANGGRTVVAADYRSFDGTLFDDAYTVDVGPPDASLAYWVTKPTDARMERVRRGRPPYLNTCTVKPRADRVAVVLHGWSRRSVREGTDMRSVYALLLCRGYTIVSPDLRGFGASTGNVASFGFHDRRDLAQLMDDLERRGIGAKRYLLLGHSYGASVAVQAAADSRVGRVIALSGQKDMLSIGAAVRSVAQQEKPVLSWLASSQLSDRKVADAVRISAEHKGLDPQHADAVAAMRGLRIPVLVAHGKKDPVVPYAHAEALAVANPAFVTLFSSETGDHSNYRETSEFLLTVDKWLEEKQG